MDSRVTEECIHADIEERLHEADGMQVGDGNGKARPHLPVALKSTDGRTRPRDKSALVFAKLGLLAGRSLWP